MKVEWSRPALLDLYAVTEHVEQDRGVEAANRVARTLYDAVQTLRDMPNRGRYGRIEGTRELVLSRLPYITVYRIEDNRVLVLAVVHMARRWP